MLVNPGEKRGNRGIIREPAEEAESPGAHAGAGTTSIGVFNNRANGCLRAEHCRYVINGLDRHIGDDILKGQILVPRINGVGGESLLEGSGGITDSLIGTAV